MNTKMKKIFNKVTLMLIVLSLTLIFGCTADKNTVKTEDEVLVSGYVLEKTIEGEEYHITLHIPKISDEDALDLELKAANKEDYDYFVQNSYYLISYGKDSLEIKNIQLNNPLGEAITKGEAQGTDAPKSKPILPGKKIDTEDYSVLDSYKFDLNEDGKEETIALYTTAQKDSNGKIMWDDGQIWVLAVHGDNNDYELYNNYVQLGSIQFYIFTADDTFHVTTVENTTAGLKLIDYVYNNAEDSFIPEIHYDVLGNVNMLHISRGY